MKINFLSKLKRFYALTKISKLNRYKKIIDKINQFKIIESQQKILKKGKKSKSLITKIVNLKFFNNLNKKIFKLENKQRKKDKNLNKKTKKKTNKITHQKIEIFNFSLFKNALNSYKVPKIFHQIKKYKLFERNLDKGLIKKNDKYNQKIGIIFYGDHNLTFVSMIINLKNKINILGVTEIPIPGNVIGDYLVEDTNELANVALDSINLLNLNNSPLLVILSSSFFTIHTFSASDLKQISLTDSKVQSKSPYLPANTLVDFLRMTDSKISSSPVRTIYSKKDLIESWTDTLQIIDLPVIGLIPAAPHIFDAITSKIIEKTTVLIDIEATSTTLLVGGKLDHLNSYKLPFGYSLYISENLNESSKNYFERIVNSVSLILEERNYEIPSNIFVMGSGLDMLINKEVTLPDGFQSISELKLADYSYNPKKMEINETMSNSLETNIYSMSLILSLCV